MTDGKRKILFLTNKLRIGGAENIIVSQANFIDKDKYQVYLGALYSTDKEENLYSKVKLDKSNVVDFGFKSLFDWSGIYRLYRFLREQKIDIIFSALFEANTAGRIAAIMARTPIIIINEQSVYFNKRFWQIKLDKLLSYWTDLIIGNAQEVVDFTARQEKINSRKFKVLKNIIDLRLSGLFNRQDLRRRLGIDQGSLVAMTVGRLNPEKAQYRIVEVADMIINQQKRNNIFFLIVGFGPLEGELRKLIGDKKLDAKVKIVSDGRNAKEYLAAGDIFLLPSDREGQPVAMLEAMQAGLAPIASDVGGVKEVIRDGQDGFIVKVGATNEMAGKLAWLADHPAELAVSQFNARVRVGEVSGKISELEKLIDEVWRKKI